MKKKALFAVVALGVAAACGETSPRPTPALAGAAGGADSAGGEPSASADAGGASNFAGEAGEAAGTSDSAGAGGASGEPTAGAKGEASGGAGEPAAEGGASGVVLPVVEGGAGGGTGCPEEPVNDEPVTLATTSLKYFEGIEVALGQGFEKGPEGAGDGTLHARGCVTGEETNAALASAPSAHSSLNVTLTGGGTPTLGTLSPYPFSVRLDLGALDGEFIAAANGPSQRSLVTLHYAKAALSSYRLEQAKRTQKDDCGTSFVRSVGTAQALAVAFRITLPTPEERATFARCYLAETPDITALDDPEPAQRYLRAHHAELSIWVLMTGGDREGVENILNFSGCSVARLQSCKLSLDLLDDYVSRIGLVIPSASTPLSDVWPWWRITSFETSQYTVLGD